MHDMAKPPTHQRDHFAADVRLEPLSKRKDDKMVQEFMVVRCYHCEAFQVQQVKKVNKWSCKSCNEKQSLMKVYGKGKAADCRKHVQKLNMMRGEKEQAEIHAHLSSNHPPEDYASTFTVEGQHTAEEDTSDHPVVVSGSESKWTTYIELQDSDDEGDGNDGTFTTNSGALTQTRKPVKRSKSDSVRPHHLSKANRSTLPVPPKGGKQKGDKIVPYSSFSQEMEFLLDDHTPTPGMSLYTLQRERYRKLDDPGTSEGSHSQSMFNLSSHGHKESIETIRKDISRFTRPLDPIKSSRNPKPGERVIPKASPRWSQFMCEDDESGEDEESRRSTHLLSGKSTVAQFTMMRDSH